MKVWCVLPSQSNTRHRDQWISTTSLREYRIISQIHIQSSVKTYDVLCCCDAGDSDTTTTMKPTAPAGRDEQGVHETLPHVPMTAGAHILDAKLMMKTTMIELSVARLARLVTENGTAVDGTIAIATVDLPVAPTLSVIETTVTTVGTVNATVIVTVTATATTVGTVNATETAVAIENVMDATVTGITAMTRIAIATETATAAANRRRDVEAGEAIRVTGATRIAAAHQRTTTGLEATRPASAGNATLFCRYVISTLLLTIRVLLTSGGRGDDDEDDKRGGGRGASKNVSHECSPFLLIATVITN